MFIILLLKNEQIINSLDKISWTDTNKRIKNKKLFYYYIIIIYLFMYPYCFIYI